MQKLNLNDPETKSLDIVAENIEQLKALFPDAFVEGKIDFDVLKQLLGDTVEGKEEKYGLNWHGKRQARQLALTPSTGTLRPCPEDSVDWDTTQNLFVEGDNLEVLKILEKSYSGKVKLIYIDPPYNIGSDFIYPDDFRDSIGSYLKFTSQANNNGELLSSNTELAGRFHTNWLNLVYPRLRLSRNLLTPDGVVLVSIGDNELANLAMTMDEIFGEENRIAIFLWKARAKPTNAGNAKFRPQKVGEYVLAYGRQATDTMIFNVSTSKQRVYPHSDSQGNYRTTTILTSNRGTYRRETMRFESGGFSPDENSRWKAGKTIIDDLFTRGRIVFNEDGIPVEKKYEDDESDPHYPIYCFMDPDLTGTAEAGKNELSELVGNKHGLDTVKPVELLKYFISTFSNESDTVLDFFAGSCTTAQATIETNIEGSATRKFIVVQLPEPISTSSEAYGAGFRTICDIGRTRLKRVIEKFSGTQDPSNENATQLSFEEGIGRTSCDLGFRVFKLDSTNIKEWEPDRDDLEGTLESNVEHLKKDRSEQDILFELLLKLGLELTVPIETKTIAKKTIYSVGAGTLIVCLATSIKREEVETLSLGIVEWHKEQNPAGETTIVFRDSAFADDVAKTNLAKILEQHDLSNVKSI